jgi:DNA uptake protein ComE-like DNA-binding protein
MRQNASILVGLLWCLALLSVMAVGVLHTARMDLIVGKNYGDRIQAHYLALAGIEKGRALLYQNAHDRSRSKKSHDGDLYNKPAQFRDIAFGRGVYRVFRRAGEEEGGGILYGISDEESRLNLNTATTDELNLLQGMTPDVLAAIDGWRGGSTLTTGAAEGDYYAALQPPSQARNGPFQTERELLMVRGIPADLVYGRDRHLNGLLEAAGEKGGEFAEAGSIDPQDLGWVGILTVHSSVNNVDAGGDDRVNVQTADEHSLTAIKGVTSDIARAIVASRGKKQFQSIADLLDVTPAQNQNGSGQSGNSGSSGGGGSSGPKVISDDLFTDIADNVTISSDPALAGAINLNTASLEVLICLPGLTRELAQAIISQRQSNGFFTSLGEVLKVSGMTHDILKQIAPLVTTRSETFRILSEGEVTSTGVRQRIQAIVHVGLDDLQTLSWREDDL